MTQPPWAALESCLERLGKQVAVVKNPDVWSSLKRGGDWDLFTPDQKATGAILCEELGKPSRTIVRSYVRTHMWPWGQIDLLPDIRWRGYILVPSDALVDGLGRSQFGTWKVRPAHEAAAACLYPTLAHGEYKKRYDAVWHQAWDTDGHEMGRICRKAFGDQVDLANWDRRDLMRGSESLRSLALSSALRDNPFMTAARTARFAALELGARLREYPHT